MARTEEHTTPLRDRQIAWGSAVAAHLVLAIALLLARDEWPRAAWPPEVRFRTPIALLPQTEGPRSFPLASASLSAQPDTDSPDQRLPEGNKRESDGPPPVPQEEEPPAVSPAASALNPQTLRELEREREQLRAQLDQEKEMAEKLVQNATRDLTPPPPPSPVRDNAPVGTIRELDLGGHSEAIVEEIMARYNLRISEKELGASIGQSFLSSASTAKGGQFTADRAGAPGVYQVFLLSPKAVSVMSKLEEQEIRRRGMDPMKTRVHRVKFGILARGAGGYDLGVLLMEAEEL